MNKEIVPELETPNDGVVFAWISEYVPNKKMKRKLKSLWGEIKALHAKLFETREMEIHVTETTLDIILIPTNVEERRRREMLKPEGERLRISTDPMIVRVYTKPVEGQRYLISPNLKVYGIGQKPTKDGSRSIVTMENLGK
jgi:hypothetical protein